MSLEYSCVYHNKGLCSKFTEPGYVSYCVFGPCSHQTPSNADHIRAMSDEELARFLEVFPKQLLERFGFIVKFEPDNVTVMLEWLQQPVKEDS